jgi:hypothetical protein
MKRVNFLIIAAALMMLAPSCKKGDNDPFLSFSSRDARISGKWVMTTLESVTTSTTTVLGVSVSNTTTTTFDGTLMTSVWTGFGGGSNSFSYTYELIVNKEGDYALKTINDGDTEETSGYWWWKNDSKKKTRIALDDDANSYEIDRLKKKEMTLVQNWSTKDTQSNGDVDETVSTWTATFTKEK